MLNNIKEYRCIYCGKLLFRGDIQHGFVEIKCKNCKRICRINGFDCHLLWVFEERGVYKRSDGTLSPVQKTGHVLSVCLDCHKKSKCDYYKIINENKACPLCKQKVC